MASPGFENRLRDHLGSEEFECKIDKFMRKSARAACKHSSDHESKEDIASTEYSLESHALFQEYLAMIESHMTVLQKHEKLSDFEFKAAIEDVGTRQPFLVRYMLASWDFQQFFSVCKDYLDADLEEEAEGKGCDDDDDGKGEK